jgi:hypothetical protein
MNYGYRWKPYVSAAKRRQRAAKKIAKLKKSGRVINPVEIEGRKIARTFWGEVDRKNKLRFQQCPIIGIPLS